jgi:hypothetical protein
MGSKEIENYEPSDERWSIVIGPFIRPRPEPEEQHVADEDQHDEIVVADEDPAG